MSEALFTAVQEAHPYPLLFATIGGSHAFGYATPYSDYDVHGVHQVPLETILGLSSGVDETVERKELEHPEMGQPVEVATHELKKFIRLLLNGNGNVLEDLYSPLVVKSSLVHQELLELGKGCISLRHAEHYKGMASNQQRKLKGNETRKFLHTYRCLLMGTYLMQTGEVEMKLPRLAEYYCLTQVFELIGVKQAAVSDEHYWVPSLVAEHQTQVERWYEKLRSAAEASHLPAISSESTRKALEALLIRVRLGEK